MSSRTPDPQLVTRGSHRELVAASSTRLVLEILGDGERYGYAIARGVRELSPKAPAWTDGMLYPLLHRLERQGYIEGRWSTLARGRRRKCYRITPSGRARIAAGGGSGRR